MYKLNLFFIFFLSLMLTVVFSNTFIAIAQDDIDDNENKFKFTTIKEVKATSVKHQGKTGTCWSFATISFIESELLRMGKDSIDLSEMFIVRHTYPHKALNFVRLHGTTVFRAGGLAHDVIHNIGEFGIVPEEIYEGRYVDDAIHDHTEMDAVLKGTMDGIIENGSGKLSNVWLSSIEAILDTYLGKPPASFVFQGKEHTPESFLKELGFNPDSYLEITSFTHHPFYSKFILEIPDNWSLDGYYNLPIDEFMLVINHAIDNGYSICWDGDRSERSFNDEKGVAILPLKDWKDKTEEEKEKTCEIPEPEKNITQELRQELFNNYTSTDDHLMHIIGTAEDQKNKKYYIAKDSFGKKDKRYNGLVYMSESYVRAKTISIMIHTDAIPKNLRKKLSIGR